MMHVKDEARRLRRRVEPVLAHALTTADASAAQWCRRFLALYSEPNYALFNTGALLKQRMPKLTDELHQWCVEPISEEHVGDPETMMTCITGLVRAVELEADAALVIETFEEPGNAGPCPCIALGLDGPGRVPEHIVLGGLFRLSFEELGERWTLASSGGRLERTENGALFRVTGMRMPPEPVPEAAEWLALLGPTPTQADLEKALALIEGDGTASPSDLKAVWREALAELAPRIDAARIEVEGLVDPALPPITIVRRSMGRFFDFVLDYALWSGLAKGAIVFMVEYKAEVRQANMVITLSAPKQTFVETCHKAAMARIISDHGGHFEMTLGTGEASISADLSDTVGIALDEWLPDWPCFTARSQQMLRLLKSGGGPPEDFILGGVLEEELETWLIPRLNTPAARNAADDIDTSGAGLAGSSKERLKKAIGQVAKGKVKKEICQPQYSGELFWAFRGQDRYRWVVGTDQVEEATVKSLAEALLASPPDALTALKRLTQLHAASGA